VTIHPPLLNSTRFHGSFYVSLVCLEWRPCFRAILKIWSYSDSTCSNMLLKVSVWYVKVNMFLCFFFQFVHSSRVRTQIAESCSSSFKTLSARSQVCTLSCCAICTIHKLTVALAFWESFALYPVHKVTRVSLLLEGDIGFTMFELSHFYVRRHVVAASSSTPDGLRSQGLPQKERYPLPSIFTPFDQIILGVLFFRRLIWDFCTYASTTLPSSYVPLDGNNGYVSKMLMTTETEKDNPVRITPGATLGWYVLWPSTVEI